MWKTVIDYFKHLNEPVDDKRLKWKLLDLLIMPFALTVAGTIAGIWFDATMKEREERIENYRHSQEQKLANIRYQQEELIKYFDTMKALVIDTEIYQYDVKEIRNDRKKFAKLNELKTLAQARTGTVLQSLNQERRDLVLAFLSYANLGFGDPDPGSELRSEIPEPENGKKCYSIKKCFLIGINLNGSDLSKANLMRAKLNYASFSEADLSEAKLSGAELKEAHLESANLSGAYLIQADLTDADLKRANLSGAVLNEAKLTGDKLDLDNAFYYQNQKPVFPGNFNLKEHNILLIAPNVNLQGKNLRGVYLADAKLTGATLTKVDMTGAKLINADLTGANLTGAKLINADLTGANLTNTIGTKLTGAKLCNTIQPNGVKSNQDCPQNGFTSIIDDFFAQG